MMTILTDSNTQFVGVGEFVGDHILQIMNLLGEERVKQLVDAWNEGKT